MPERRQVVAPAPKSAGSCPNPCVYTDDAGTYHLVEGLDEIPAKYRARAAGLRTDSIQLISGSPASGPVPGSAVGPSPGTRTESGLLEKKDGTVTFGGDGKRMEPSDFDAKSH